MSCTDVRATPPLPALGPLLELRRAVSFATFNTYYEATAAAEAAPARSASPAPTIKTSASTPGAESGDALRAALKTTLHESEEDTLARLERIERGANFALTGIHDLLAQPGPVSLDALKQIVRRQQIAAMTGADGRDLRPLTSNTKAFWAAAPRDLIILRAAGLISEEPPINPDPAAHPRVDGEQLLAWHVEDGCDDCTAGRECYIWSLRANTAALTLPFKPEMRPLFGLDPDKASWKGADLSTESGRAWVAAVNELKSLGVLQSAVRSRESCIAPSHVVAKQGIAFDEHEKAAMAAYSQSAMHSLAKERAELMFTEIETKAAGRAWTADLFALMQSTHRNGPIKWRLVVSMNRTVNDLVEDWPFVYINFAEYFGQSWTTADHTGKLDIVKGFYCVEIAESDRVYMQIRDPSDPTGETLLQFVRLPMGYKLAPAFFSAVTAELERHFNHSEHAKAGAKFGFFVDDLGIKGDGPSGRGAAAQQYARDEAPKARFKWAVGAGKDEPMAPVNTITGLRFDSNVGGSPMVQVAAPALYTTLVDLALIKLAVERAPACARFPVSFLRSTAGRASWVAQTMYAARLRTSSLWYAATHAGASRHAQGTVRVAGIGGLHADSAWFLDQARHGRLRGSRRIKPDALAPHMLACVEADASGARDAGAGAIWDGRALWHAFRGNEIGWSIQAKELSPLVAAAERWGAEWAGRVVLLHTDNFGNALGINSAKALPGPALELLRRLYELADLHGFEVLSVWLPRSRNTRADGVSKATSLAEARRNAVASGAVAAEAAVTEY